MLEENSGSRMIKQCLQNLNPEISQLSSEKTELLVAIDKKTHGHQS